MITCLCREGAQFTSEVAVSGPSRDRPRGNSQKHPFTNTPPLVVKAGFTFGECLAFHC